MNTPLTNKAPVPPMPSRMNYREALSMAMREALAFNPNALILGQGVTDHKAVFGTVTGLHKEFPGRVIATELVNPDFAAYARAFGGFGVTVEKTDDFVTAFRAAEASGMPSIIHVKYDGEGITPTTTLSGMKKPR